jgi:hypothetical protein
LKRISIKGTGFWWTAVDGGKAIIVEGVQAVIVGVRRCGCWREIGD